MSRKPISDFIIPAREARAFEVRRGQSFQIYQVEGGQVGDCVFYNAHDYKEMFHVGQSWTINVLLGTGNASSFKHFYSKPPRENVMLSLVEDTVRRHWGNMGGRCSRRLYELRDNLHDHRSCQENLAEALLPYGITGDDIIDIFNVFMHADMDTDGNFKILPTTVTRSDYIELRAEMDVLAAVSACPADHTSPVNQGTCKSLGIRIFG